MVKNGERHSGRGDQAAESQAAIPRLADFGISLSLSSRWQLSGTVSDEDYRAWLDSLKGETFPTSAGLRNFAKRQIAALETYLRGKEMQRPMMGASRRIEGRIGQLLGKPEKGGRGKTHTHADEFERWGDRTDFRLLARALANECELTADEWRKSRRSLVSLIRNRLGC